MYRDFKLGEIFGLVGWGCGEVERKEFDIFFCFRLGNFFIIENMELKMGDFGLVIRLEFLE